MKHARRDWDSRVGMNRFSPNRSGERPIELLTPTSRRSCSTCRPSYATHALSGCDIQKRAWPGHDGGEGGVCIIHFLLQFFPPLRVVCFDPTLFFVVFFLLIFILLFFSHCGCYFLSLSLWGGRDLHTSASSLNASPDDVVAHFSQQPFAPRVNGQRLPSFSRSADLNGGKIK